MKRAIIPLAACLALSLCTHAALAQRPGPNTRFPEIPAHPSAAPTAGQTNAWQQFQDIHSKWKVEWGNQSDATPSLFGPAVTVAGSTPLETARKFLESVRKVTGMTAGLPNLKPVKIEQHLRADHVIFQQMYEDIPIEGGIYTITMNKNGGVYYVSGDYFDDVQVESTRPAVSQAQAIIVATSDLGPDLKLRSEPEGKLIVLPYGATFRLAWKVIVPAEEPSGRWLYYLSARDGSILGGYNMAHDATADGQVYAHNPDRDGAAVSRQLTHLDGSGFSLNGSYVHVLNEDGSEAYETDGTFNYSSSNTHFDEVMVYYHVTEFQKYMGAEVGYTYLNYPGTLVEVTATVHYGTNFNNAQAISPSTLRFGDGDGTNYNDFAKEDDVIGHEYQHLITDYLTYDGLTDGDFTYSQENAMSEGFSDYFGGSYADSPKIDEYVLPGPGSLRNMDNSYTVSDWDGGTDDEFPSTNFHKGSQIFTGALWDLRQDVGENTANVLIFEGLDDLNQASPTFQDARNAILMADQDLYSSSHECSIEDAFRAHGIGTGCTPLAPTGVTISGNIGDHPQISWNASAGATSYYVYRCYYYSGHYCSGYPLNHEYIGGTSGTSYTDTESILASSGDLIYYYVKAHNSSGFSPESSGSARPGGPALKAAPELPDAFALHGNAPNPFSRSTKIRFDLPEAAHVRLGVYNMLGQEVRELVNADMPAGFQHVTLSTEGLSSGVYLYRITAGEYTETRRMVVAK